MEGFRHIFSIDVRFRDLDALGHVNNAVYFTYLEAARVDYFRQVVFGHKVFAISDLTLVLADITCSFKRPVIYGQHVRIGTRTTSLGRASYRLDSTIEADGVATTVAQAVLVEIDPETGRSRPIPAWVRERIATYDSIPLRP